MTKDNETLEKWVKDISELIQKKGEPEPPQLLSFLQDPKLACRLVDLIDATDEEEAHEEQPYYSACIFAFDICIAELQSAQDVGYKSATKILESLMSHLATVIYSGKHSLSFWLPILNAFYDVHLDLSPELRDAYFELAGNEDDTVLEEKDHIQAIKEMIAELSDLSAFDIADNFFAQSHAMPVEFFADLIIDLCSLEEGLEIAILALLHPKQDVRDIVFDTLDYLMNTITLNSVSLMRLQAIKHWYPESYRDQFSRWTKMQRLKGVVLQKENVLNTLSYKASEIDGSGAQGLFIHVKHRRKNRLCGLLFKQGVGIKDAWLTPELSATDMKKYYHDAFDESVTFREVNDTYVRLIANHFLAITLEQGHMPDLHLLEIQELTGIHFLPERMDIEDVIDHLSIQITPFTSEVMSLSFKRSKTWLNKKQFTESWYIENAEIDKLVNRCSSFVNGVKVCEIEDAIAMVFEEEMEAHREKWLFHFLWITLWLKAHARKNEKIWQDSFMIAYAIHEGIPLSEIPVMYEIGRQTVINSVETMHERRTHLSKE